MKITRIGLIVLGVGWLGLYESVDGQPAVAPSVQAQQPVQASADGDMLYDLVRQLRAELRELRLAAGLGAYAAGPRAGRPDSHAGAEGNGEHEQQHRKAARPLPV
ncbi:MAG: hypothetical protein OXI83_14620, partial [Gemmatimonadota bacterium]|nr:hypothetical protein [Gemmatimonadota bacterium]